MAGGLTIEVDEDVPLVENAATASLFSPGMWVQRPSSRTHIAAVLVGRDEELVQLPGAAAPPASGSGGPASERPSPMELAADPDPDLAYLHIADDRDHAEKEYAKQDSEHMAALEDAYAKLREQNRVMEHQLKGVVAAVNDVMEENRTIKQLLAMLQVRREDFVFNPQQTIAAQQEAIGMRLLRNLEGSPPGAPPAAAAPPPQQQQQQAAGSAGATQQQQQQGAATDMQQQQGEDLSAAAAAAGFDPFEGSPSLLPITPGMRTVSPKIAAFRHDQQQAGAQQQQQQQQVAPPTVVPASPYDFPAEAQIAAAALTAKQGDTAAALLTLLDKAIEGRLERQQQQQLVQQQQQPPRQQAQPMYHHM